MSSLERAVVIAAEAHAGQEDKVAQPYILHVLRVMLRCDSEPERITAVLHDIIEDTDWTSADLLREGFTSEIVQAVEALTKRKNEDYESFIQRLADNQLACRVKKADLEDNMDMTRIPDPSEEDFERYNRYQSAYEWLKGVSTDSR